MSPSPTVVHFSDAAVPLVELPSGATVTTISPAVAASTQLRDRADIVVLGLDAQLGDAGRRRAVLHAAIQHLDRHGRLMVLHGALEEPLDDAAALDLHPDGRCLAGEAQCSTFRRGDRFTVHDLLFEARRDLRRVDAIQLMTRLQHTPAPLVVDTRTAGDRARFGTIEGSVHLPRTVVEWRADPANCYLHPAIAGFDQPMVVVCNHGYSSSLTAANLQRLGHRQVADLIGGVHAWVAAGLPVVPPDHTFLEL